MIKKHEFEKIYIEDVSALKKLFDDCIKAKEFALDTETSSLDVMHCIPYCVSIAYDLKKAYMIDWNLFYAHQKEFNKLLEVCRVIFHNAKYDMELMWRFGYKFHKIRDTMIMSYLNDPDDQHGLKVLANKFLGWEMTEYSDLGADFRDLMLSDKLEYACSDAMATLCIAKVLESKIKSYLDMEEMELALLPVLAKMEMLGLKVDVNYLEGLRPVLDEFIEKTKAKVYELTGNEFELDSSQQVAHVLFDILKLPAGRPGKNGKPSTAASVLEKLAEEHEVPKLILEYREAAKIRATYIDGLIKGLDENGVLHAGYMQCAVPTHRLASGRSNIGGENGGFNIQNIPKKPKKFNSIAMNIRECFVARPGCKLLSADYKQVEFRIFVQLANERKVIRQICDGVDIHVATASFLFGKPVSQVTDDERDVAKTMNFALIYGMDYRGLAERLKISLDEAQDLYNKFFDNLPNARAWTERVKKFAITHKFVKTYFGFRRYIRDLESNDKAVRARGLRGAVNSVVQGSAADIMRIALVRLGKHLIPYEGKINLLCTVHDQVVVEYLENMDVNEVMAVINAAMVFPVSGWEVPMELDFSWGLSWGSMEKIKFVNSGVKQVNVVLKDVVSREKISLFKELAKTSKGDYNLRLQFNGQWVDCKTKVEPNEAFLKGVGKIFGEAHEVFVSGEKVDG